MNASMCPKCGGGAYLLEEELIKILEGTNPLKILLRANYVCRACSEKFSRIIYDDLVNRKHKTVTPDAFSGYTQPQPAAAQPVQSQAEKDAAESLRFF